MSDKEVIEPVEQHIIQTPIVQEMERAFMDYAMSVIVARALPDVRDGLKPVHRRIVFAAHETGLHSTSRYQKCAALVGETMKKYHPHGDLALYDSLVRMGQDFSLRYPLIDGQGNFGSVDGDSPAAMRYTECRLAKISDALLTDIDKDTVKFIPNYSGDFLEPEVLPSILPNLLLNGSAGIAVGMATNIPPHNLREVVDAILFCLEHPKPEIIDKTKPIFRDLGDFETESEISELAKIVKGPDFPTGGHIYGKKDIEAVYATGRGRILARAEAEIVEGKKGFQIVITEIPYMVNKAELVAKIADLARDKKLEGISDLRDESSRAGMRIVVDLKKDANPQLLLNQLFKHTALQTAFNANFVALVQGEPKTLNLKSILEEFVKHRQVVIFRRTEFLLKEARAREHILQGLKIALDHLDEVIKTIRASKDADDAKAQLIKKFGLDDLQATAILDMMLRRLAALERQKIEEELAAIIKLIGELTELLESKVKILSVIKNELGALREKYGDERKTKVHPSGVGEFEIEDLIPEASVVVSLTNGGYLKRMPSENYKSQSRGGKGVTGGSLKEEDSVTQILTCNTHDNIYFFTDRGKVYLKRAWDIPEGSRTSRGSNAVNLLAMVGSEKILSILSISNDSDVADKPSFIFMATRKGTVKKTPLNEFANVRSSGITAIKLEEGDSLVWAKATSGQDEIMLVTAEAKSIRFNESDVRPMGRAAAGVRGISLRQNDFVVGTIVSGSDSAKDASLDERESRRGSKLLVVSDRGFGKQTKLEEYPVQKRGGTGIFAGKVTEKTGPLVAALRINKDSACDLILTSKKGQVIRLPIKDVPTLSRSTQGVTLMRFEAGDGVAAVTDIEVVC